MAGQTRFSLNRQEVKRDELVEIRALMVPQFERVAGAGGFEMRRRMPKKFECKVGGEMAFSTEFGPSSTTSAYVQFKIKVRESTVVVATWTNFDDSVVFGGSAEIRVV